LIRDRTGVKPLYFYHKNGLFMFASELKSFHQNPYFKKELDINVLAQYLQFGYILEPYSIFKNTYKLRAGYYLELDLKTREYKEVKYWDVIDFYNKPKTQISEKEAIEETERLLKSAFSYRMVADVPVGVFLSGGYDSSAVVAILQSSMSQKLKTFTIGFEEKEYNEAPFAKKVAEYLGTDHTEYYCTQKDALEIIPKLPEIYDEPFGDSSAIPTVLVSKLARQYVKVSLSADGGDEIFGGYTKYTLALNYFSKFSKVPLKSLIHHFLNLINPSLIPYLNKTYNFETRYLKVKNILKARDIIEVLKYISQHFTDNQIENLFTKNIQKLTSNFDLQVNNDNISKMLAIDYKTYLVDDILTKVDRATMSVSLEGREPLLDYRIIEFVSQLPSYYKIRNGEKKWLLKQIVHKYLPKEMMDRPKKGFAVPIFEWFRKELKEYMLYYLSQDRLEKEEIFNVKEIIKLRDKYLSGSRENIQRLWFILMFEMWRERWM
jgi:asparagine synthase (glutamine-hydrolysing)